MLVPVQLCLNVCDAIGPSPPGPSPSPSPSPSPAPPVLPYRVPDSFPMASGGGGGGGPMWQPPPPEPMPIESWFKGFKEVQVLEREVVIPPPIEDDLILSMWQRSLERTAENLERKEQDLETTRTSLAMREALSVFGWAEREATVEAREAAVAAREAVPAPEPVVHTRTVYVEVPVPAPETVYEDDLYEPAPLVLEPRRRPLAAFLPLLATAFVAMALVTVLVFTKPKKRRRRRRRRVRFSE